MRPGGLADFRLGGEVFSAYVPMGAFNVPADTDVTALKALLVRGRQGGWWHVEGGSGTDEFCNA